MPMHDPGAESDAPCFCTDVAQPLQRPRFSPLFRQSPRWIDISHTTSTVLTWLLHVASMHGPSFLKQYEAFWVDPDSISILWVGLLYSMICLALIASDPPTDVLEHQQQRLQTDLYREKLVQCLMLCGYTLGGKHALETLINYVYVEFRIHDDADKDVWFLLGLEVNLAKRMGYHRDPRHFPDMTPLQAEMRRRVWATVLLVDVLISGQMGMPRMVRDGEFDTAEPQNLNDENLREDMPALPEPRPETEHTTTLGVIARRRILVALGTISDSTASLNPCTYAEIMRLDQVLNEAGMSIPPPLKAKPMAASITDSPRTIMSRLFLSHMFYKGKIMLHRRVLFARSMSPARDTFAYSRAACLEASLATLKIQQVLDEETRPGSQLHTMHWKVGSIMNQHFLTATMNLCSLVHRKQVFGRGEDIRSALRTARGIWMRKGNGSREAQKAGEAVGFVLAQAGGPRFDASLSVERDYVVGESRGGMSDKRPPNTGMTNEAIGYDNTMETTILFNDTFDIDPGKRVCDEATSKVLSINQPL
ncbi:putative transcriptional regulatory protein [Colletotrichum tanaceti]|uniref:Putative transcriptional regulatory protein n=1 Tax=Colletotrichum tanaceti TaxID=1306861 RepID=A0A4U6XHK0_9PEZI|nr:putative transcriptional regulatory protein [Colletotrichum tanaceti]TKW53537.1 putative transcriptional regulatory protein [Colletotrichum tanaceti]